MDLPPGTADLQQQLLGLIRPTRAVIVVSPQDVAHLDARKALELLGRAQVPILGGVENFATLACPHCGRPVEVFPQVPQPRSIWAAGVALLGRVPVDPLVADASDSGRPLARTPGRQHLSRIPSRTPLSSVVQERPVRRREDRRRHPAGLGERAAPATRAGPAERLPFVE